MRVVQGKSRRRAAGWHLDESLNVRCHPYDPGMSRKVDPAEAERVIRAAGCNPLVPYPGSAVPWPSVHEKCGSEIAPHYANVRARGRACKRCAGVTAGANRRAGFASGAVQTMRAAGCEPLEPYPGADKPWRCLHQPCETERTPSLNTVRANGTACRECSAVAAGRRVWTSEDAEAVFRDGGLEPLVPWPGSSSKPWRARHVACGREVTPRLGNVAAGQGPCNECGQEAAHAAMRLDEVETEMVFRAAGLEPLVAFPGVDRPWRSRHVRCGGETAPTYSNIKRGQGGCVTCGAKDNAARLLMPEPRARAVMVARGLDPIEPYPGSSRPWKSRHACGRVVSPTLANVSGGKGICRYCNSAFPYNGPAMLYLVVDRDAVKIGCASRNGKRLADHQRFGWEVAWTVETATGDDAYNLEQAILSWWREELCLPPAYPAERLPQSGYSETALWDDMHPTYVLTKVRQLVGELQRPPLVVNETAFATGRPERTASGLGPRLRAKLSRTSREALFELDHVQ